MRFFVGILSSLLVHAAILLYPSGEIEGISFQKSFSQNALDISLLKIKTSFGEEKKLSSDSIAGEKGVIAQAKIIGSFRPRYPIDSRRLGHQGVVILGARIDKLGKANKVWAVKSSGHESLDKEAIRALKESDFHPARQNGKAIDYEQKFSLRFELK